MWSPPVFHMWSPLSTVLCPRTPRDQRRLLADTHVLKNTHAVA